MSQQPIYLRKQGEIAEIVLNRPDKLNALNSEVWQGISQLAIEAAEDWEVKVVILRGATEEAFAAGADISEFETVHASPESAREYDRLIRAAYDAVGSLNKPTIAMVRGVCFGGGCALSLCCDMRYVDTTARFCIPPARLGIAYSLVETKRLSDLVGPSRAKEMLMGARVIEAHEAVEIGLATRLFQPEGLDEATHAFARQLCDLSQFTIRAVKSIVEEILDGAAEETETSQRLRVEAFDGPDYLEGRSAFLEKRPPKFTFR
ncbi:MAG: enoyl-CoA hydratase-related protein [Alphaproteobacteria bacterium]|jgi:enoyl-CoA hydratase/carnithine racemase|nr:enoyl-CoA hydratase-related protein [Alphaproteobacteria bacterium]MDP6565436.1 enoyl-CoA hydratase-related protein [Alphaproteobacteria bacterium]MDP6814467.1 enoyl-CoA hydratase-related protein [Alphaproteobacteria bacterium]